MTLANRISHQPKSNKEPSDADLIFSIGRLLDVLQKQVSTVDEVLIIQNMREKLEMLK
jgi:hypothetical protein